MNKNQKNKSRKRELSDSNEEVLTKKLFGNSVVLPDSEGSSSEEENPEDVVDEEAHTDEAEDGSALKPVWHDDDDDELEVDLPTGRRKSLLRVTDLGKQKLTGKEYEQRLREEFSRNYGTGRSALKWARIQPDEPDERNVGSDSEDVEEVLKEMTAKTGKYLAKSDSLPKGVVDCRRAHDITRGHRLGKKPLNAVHFHPSRQVLLTAGLSGVISLFEVGLERNEEAFLQDVRFKEFPIAMAEFSKDGTKVIAGSKRQVYFFSYDLMNGKVMQLKPPTEMTKVNSGLFTLSEDGKYMAVQARNEVYVLSIATMEVFCVLSPPSTPTSLQFSPASPNSLFALTEASEICIWDIRNASEMHTFRDSGGVIGTTLRISNNSQFLACGSNTGIVNLYETKDVYHSTPEPVAVYDQLTTRIDDIVFSKDTQIMLISSNVKQNAARLVHLRSRSVFNNFPCRTGSIGKPTVSDFSPNTGYMAIGDMSGFLSLFRLKYFENY